MSAIQETPVYDAVTLWALDFEPRKTCEIRRPSDPSHSEPANYLSVTACTGQSRFACIYHYDAFLELSAGGATCMHCHRLVADCWVFIPIAAS